MLGMAEMRTWNLVLSILLVRFERFVTEIFLFFGVFFFFCWHIFVHVFAMKMIGNIRNFFWKISALIGFLILISLLIFFFFFILDFEMIF